MGTCKYIVIRLRISCALRMALGSVGGPGSEAGSVVLSLGLGLTVLAAVGQIDANLRGAIARDLPKVAPSYFVVDIQTDQLDGFLALARGDTEVSRADTAPRPPGSPPFLSPNRRLYSRAVFLKHC